ncbi:methyltransferase [Hymenobacter aerilatus]|uniref:Methyltransferase n=1 Tax=Hymenobacter aerilatus TaxID=2932251 RepID=A0A8T9SZ42_9BACT|nr:methyltransferase [Hymenobacter aerilatus]UOR06194.1 methyltransferase [Hymenobacter aerilatus]
MIAGGLLLLTVLAFYSVSLRPYFYLLMGALAGPTLLSLAVSYYVYDYSNLYTFKWLTNEKGACKGLVLNIHAGFDETSTLLQQRFISSTLRVLDFYNPAEHTEVSIRRARVAYPPYPTTESVQPHALPVANACAEWIFVVLAAHEIRQPAQRVAFFTELRRVVHPHGRIVVVEHLRDPANFLAYTIGFLHFFSRATWQSTFLRSGLTLEREQKVTPFISAFILRPSGSAA